VKSRCCVITETEFSLNEKTGDAVWCSDHEDAGKHKGEIAMETRTFQTSLVDTCDW
jgi:hypothetical protein